MNKALLTAATAAARLGAVSLLASGVLFAQTTPTTTSNQANQGQPQKLEKFVVTGSLIPMAAGAPANPVTVISTMDIERSGINTDILNVLKKTEPYFYGSNNIGSDNGNIGSGATNGGSSVALRNRATLVLINGRRANVAPVLASNGASFVDVSLIPISAVERVEVLTDGASATYGSDAVSGVVNVILKTNYSGVEFGGRYGWSPNDGNYSERNYFAVAGATVGNTSVTISTDWKKSDPLIQGERPYGKGQFRTPSFAGSVNIAGATDFYYLNPNTNAPPQNLELTPAQAVAQGLYAGPLTQDQVAQNFDLSQYPTMLLEHERRSFVAAVEHVLNDRARIFADFMYSNTRTQSILNAQPVSGNVAATHPSNPFNVTITARNRFVTFPRIYNTDTLGLRGVIGIKGSIANSSWTYEAAGNFNRSVSNFKNNNLIDTAAYNAAVANGTYNPFARTQAPGVVEGMLGTSYRDYTSELNGFDVRVGGELVNIAAGAVQLALGAETRWESLRFTNDRSDQTGGWLQATPRQPFSARATVDGFFGELRVPIFGEGNTMPFAHKLDASIAGRKDVYSSTSDPFVPKYTLRWMPFNDEFAVRGTYSESFSAPTLIDLYGPISAGFTSSININRYSTSGTALGTTSGSRQYRSRSGSNINLRPSESRNWTAGIVWSPKKVRGLEISADWFSIDERDLVNVIPTTTIVNSVEQLGPASPYAGLVKLGASLSGEVHFDDGAAIATPGQMTNRPSDEVWISNQLVNVAGVWQQGLDARIAYSYDTKSWGVLSGRMTGLYLHEYYVQTLPNGNAFNYTDGFSGSTLSSLYARYRANTSLGWAYRKWTAGINHTYIPSVDDVAWTTEYRIKSYHTFDAHVGFSFAGSGMRHLEGLSFTVGVNNVFNKYPPLALSEGNQSHDINAYDPIGRFIWVHARYKF